MGDRIAVLNFGDLMQIDSPRNLYENPNNIFVAGFIGSPSMNFFDATLVKEEGNLIIDTGSFRLPVPADRAEVYKAYVGKEVIFGIRPEHIHGAEYAPPNINAASLDANIDVIELLGHELHLYLNSGKSNYVATVDTRMAPSVGDDVKLVVDMNNMHIFDKDTEQTIR